MKDRFDSTFIGVNVGIIAPMLAFGLYFLLYNMRFNPITFDEYIDLSTNMGILPQVLSLSLLGNLAAFSISMWMGIYNTAKGIILATFLYGVAILILKYAT